MGKTQENRDGSFQSEAYGEQDGLLTREVAAN